MVNLVSKVAAIGAVFIAVLYQFVFKSIIFDTLGYGRQVLTIKDFQDVRCERVTELGLEGCEDMWLHQPTGFLYMACSDSQSRTKWLPAFVTSCSKSTSTYVRRVGFLNATARGLTDRIAVLDTRGSGRLASRIKWLSVEDFSGIRGDKTLNLHGFDVRVNEDTEALQILLINHRPPIDPENVEPLDGTVFGANSTIEHFQTEVGSDTMRHVKTYTDPLIQTPNRVAWLTDHSFVFTNDRSGKVGFRRELDPLLGGGSVGYCDQTTCNIAFSGLKLPNGLVVGQDGLVYVPSSVDGSVKIFKLSENHILVEINEIKVPMPIDNLSVDKRGDIYVAAFPKLHAWAESSKNPFDVHPPSAVFRIRKSSKGHDAEYVVEKVLEDDGSVLPGTTTAVHDAETGKVYLGGVMSAYITICEPALPDDHSVVG